MAMIKCMECGKEISERADKCPFCGFPVKNDNANNQFQDSKNKNGKTSGLSIAALVLSVLGCSFIIGLVLAIIDLCKKDGRKKTCSIIALVICGLWLVMGVSSAGKNDTPKKIGENITNPKIESTINSDQATNKTDSFNTETESGESIFKKGEIAELNGVQVTLTDYSENSGGEWNKPTDGNIFLMVEFEIVNNTDKELTVSSALSFDAYADDYSLNYSFSALMEKDGNQLDGTVAAGKKMKGWIGWEVPQDYNNVEIHFTDNVWSNNKFVFLIEK